MKSNASDLSNSFAERFAGVQKAPSQYAIAIYLGCHDRNNNNFYRWINLLRGFNASNWSYLEKKRFQKIFKDVLSQTSLQTLSLSLLEGIMNNAVREDIFPTRKTPTRKRNVKLTNALADYCISELLAGLIQVRFSDLEVEVLLIWINAGKGDLLQSYVDYICTNCPSDERSRKASNWNSKKLPLILVASLLFSALTIYFLIGLASVPHYIAVVALLWFVTTMYSAMLFGLLD